MRTEVDHISSVLPLTPMSQTRLTFLFLFGMVPLTQRVQWKLTWQRAERAKPSTCFSESYGEGWRIGEIRSDVDKKRSRGGRVDRVD
jgi:hypothetical protein